MPRNDPQSTAIRATKPPPRSLRSAKLGTQVVESLRDRIRDHEWGEGEKLPTEAQLAAEYDVSRYTVRTALNRLETQGMTITRHGLGTFVSPLGNSITAGLQELRSMMDTIRAHGMEPEMRYHDASIRPATGDEAAALDVAEGTRVLSTERLALADGVEVAYSYEVIPMDLLPGGLRAEDVTGSLFALLDASGAAPHSAVAEIHAASGPDIGWGERSSDQVYVELRQIHYTEQARVAISSRTYFPEGRFQFSILRVR